jgi:hypothetical protein
VGQSESGQQALFDAPAPAAAAPVEDLERFASISHCKRYRFALMRAWVPKPERYVMFVGLNPSTADGMVEDPTMRRCIRFARDWGFDGLWMGNLFAFRATDPANLPDDLAEAIGPPNVDPWLREMRGQSELCIAAWGAHASAQRRAAAVLELLGDVQVLGVTKDGHPRHPLYMRADARPIPWTTTEAAA